MSDLQEVRDDIAEAEKEICEIVSELHDKHDVSIDGLRLRTHERPSGGTVPSLVKIDVSL